MLNPTGKDYTYIPNAQGNINCSRIDYFLVTSNLIQSISESGIGINRLSTLFDHKPVSLQIGRKQITVDRNKICNGILDNVIIDLTVTLAVKEFYLNNADRNAVPQFTINPIRYEIGRIYNYLKMATDLELSSTIESDLTDLNRRNIATWTEMALDIAHTLPNLEFFEQLPLSVDPAIFFEGLIMSVRNEILAKQSAIYRTRNHRKKILRSRIFELKKNLAENCLEIYRHERTLDNLIEQELKTELDKFKIFERVNSEKITPHFLNVIRGVSHKNADVGIICNDDDQPFVSEPEREKYITDTFADIYKKPVPVNNGNVPTTVSKTF
jgi:hypothetical protein